jgi:hypothetical protein
VAKDKRFGTRRRKVLQFPKPPEQPQTSTITVQIGGDRFAIHWQIEELPPATPRQKPNLSVGQTRRD